MANLSPVAFIECCKDWISETGRKVAKGRSGKERRKEDGCLWLTSIVHVLDEPHTRIQSRFPPWPPLFPSAFLSHFPETKIF